MSLDDILGKIEKPEEPEVEEYPIGGMCTHVDPGNTGVAPQMCFYPLENVRVDMKNKKAKVICTEGHVEDIPWEMLGIG